MEEKLRDLSKAEWLLIKVCWRQGKCSVRNVFEDESLGGKQWEYQTVKTMMDRLVKKGYLEREKFGPIYLYEPTISRGEVVKQEITRFVDTVLDNALVPLVAHFAKEKKLGKEEISSLKALIQEYEDDTDD